MSSNLRVDRILPSTGTEVGVGTATGSVALYGDVNVAGTLTYEDVTNIDSVGIVTARSDVYLGNDIYLTDGSSGHEQVEVDSNDIRVTGKHIHSQFGVWTGSSSGNDRRNGISGDNNDLRLYSNSTEKVRITSLGNLGIGDASPTKPLTVGTTTPVILLDDQSSRTLEIRGPSTTHSATVLTTSVHDLLLGTNNTERLRITSDGKVAIGFNAPAVAGLSISNSSTNRGFEFDTGSGFDSTSCIRAYDRPTTAYKSLGLTGSDIKFGINDVEKVRISSSGLAINKNAAADTDIEIVQSADPTLRLYDTRNAAYKADFMMAGSAPLIRNNNTSASDRTLSIQKGTTDHLVIEGSGNVNIGANGSSNLFTYLRFGASQYGAADIRPTDEASHKVGLAFYVDGTQDTTINPVERIRIDSSGRLLVGHSSLTGDSDSAYSKLVVNGNTQASSKGGILSLEHTQPVTNVYNNHQLGQIFFKAETGEEFGSIKVEAQGNASSTSSRGRLMFSTTNTNATTPTERMRIDCDGATTLRAANYGLGVRSIAGSSSVNTAYFGAHSSGAMTTGTITFEVYTNGNVKNTNNSYGQLSDERLKENIIDAPSQWDDIKSLQIRKYNFRDGNGYDTHTQIGLVAQEVESVSPGLVQETPIREDATPVLDAEGNELEATKSVLTSVLYMKAIKALQEAQTRIEALEAAVAALQGS